MNIRLKNISIILSFLYMGTVVAAGFVDSLEKNFGLSVDTQKIFFTAAEEKRERLAELKKEKKAWQIRQKKAQASVFARIQEIKITIATIKASLQEKSDDEFLAAKLALINEDYQILSNLSQLREQIESLMDQSVIILEDYLKDPALAEYKTRLNLMPRDVYSFADLEHINQLLLDQKKSIEQLKEQEKNIKIELKNRKHTAAATEQEHKQKKDVQVLLAGASKREIDPQQQRVLFALEEQLYTDKKERDLLRLKEIDYKKVLIAAKIFTHELQLEALKDILTQVKPAIKVSEADLILAQEEVAKKKRDLLTQKEAYRKESEELAATKKEKEQQLHDISKQYGVPLGESLDEWYTKPARTIERYHEYVQVADLYEQIQEVQRKRELLDAHSALADEKIRYESMHLEVMQSIYKITTNKFGSEDETKKEVRKYAASNAETQANIVRFRELLAQVQEQSKKKKAALHTLDELRIAVKNQTTAELLGQTEALIKQQIDTLSSLDILYTDIIVILEKTDKQRAFVVSELALITIWQRPEYAITWEGVQDVIPNIQTFIGDMHSHIAQLDGTNVIKVMSNPLAIFFLIFQIFLLCLIGLMIRWALLFFASFLRSMAGEHRKLRFGSLLCVFILEFSSAYIVFILPWVTLLLFMQLYPSFEPYVYILFYCASIPYLLYLAYCFIGYLRKFNEAQGNPFFGVDFQRRFIAVLSISLYATIIILLFRKAYILGFYFKSELPEILLLVWIIILQISLICLLTKDHIVGIIPDHGGIWRWTRTKVDQYYYIILMLFIAIMVMSNPFVGFGKLVIYVLARLIKTVVALSFFYWLNIFLRRGFSHIFFTTEHEVARERFGYGKSLYGFVVIATFLSFIFIGAVCVAKIWSWPQALARIVQWSDVIDWLKTPILLPETAKISVFSMLQVLFFVFMGALVAQILNVFVLDKIFDILLVESGVQNTISSIVRYVIFMVAVILGFQSIDLVVFVWAFMSALALGIGWIIKDPMGDFIAYFIILVQRPLKIGDYIKMDDEIMGVVRKITPRSVVLRKKNSTTIVLPNSQVITRAVINWNYLRGFIAIDDIIVTVGFKEDPAVVQKLFLEILAGNQYVLKNPQPIVRLDNFSEFGFQFMVRGYISSNYTLDQWDIASNIRLAMAQRLRESNITIAVPTRVILQKTDTHSGHN